MNERDRRCRTCRHWAQPEYHKFPKNQFGGCESGKLVYDHMIGTQPPEHVDCLLYSDREMYEAHCATGAEFGCVHWQQKQEAAQ